MMVSSLQRKIAEKWQAMPQKRIVEAVMRDTKMLKKLKKRREVQYIKFMVFSLQRKITAKLLSMSQKRIIEVVRPDMKMHENLRANNYLAGYADDVASQGGEDGVIQQIFKTLGFKHPGWCVEFGACDGKRDSNTWNLVRNYGWKAVYVEPEPAFFRQLEQNCKDRADIWCFNELVGWEGENSLDNILARTPIPAEFEMLCIDVDGPDYYIWEALERYRPHVVCIEFHRLISPKVHYVPQKGETSRPSSLRALYELGKRKGYELVCAINWNAFFVRKEHFAKFNIQDNHPESMFYTSEEMRTFQGYDGTLFLHPIEVHYWKFQIGEDGKLTNLKISQRDIQVIPDGLRIFRPRHTYRSVALEKQAGKLDISRVPGNILLSHRRNVNSENGEDGIIEHIFKTIGTSHRFCVDIGACDGKLWSNSRNLIGNQGWKGLLLESDTDNFAKLTANYKGNSLTRAVNAYVTPQNLENILTQYNIPHDFDLLTMDIEGNDYHLFTALRRYHPRMVVIDFNPSVPNDIRFVQEYSAQAHHGASLRSLMELAAGKGYGLAAATDWNAIFVRHDLFPKLGIAKNDIDSMYYPPFEMRMFQTLDGCVHLLGCKTLVRQDYVIEWEDFQILPRQLRGHDNSAENFGKMKTVFYP